MKAGLYRYLFIIYKPNWGVCWARPTNDIHKTKRRIKNLITKGSNHKNRLNIFNFVRYFWKKNDLIDVSQLPKDNIGFIAQEIREVVPEFVYGNETDTEILKVKYGDIVTLCIEAIKEQSILLDLKEQRLESLENKAKEKGLI